ncbi:hypothetical protein Agub_g5410, partial [Astrephomene gubernaculifera]
YLINAQVELVRDVCSDNNGSSGACNKQPNGSSTRGDNTASSSSPNSNDTHTQHTGGATSSSTTTISTSEDETNSPSATSNRNPNQPPITGSNNNGCSNLHGGTEIVVRQKSNNRFPSQPMVAETTARVRQCGGCFGCCWAHGGVLLRVRTSKESYEAGETVEVIMEIENRTDVPFPEVVLLLERNMRLGGALQAAVEAGQAAAEAAAQGRPDGQWKGGGDCGDCGGAGAGTAGGCSSGCCCSCEQWERICKLKHPGLVPGSSYQGDNAQLLRLLLPPGLPPSSHPDPEATTTTTPACCQLAQQARNGCSSGSSPHDGLSPMQPQQ